ncbi:MAG TPA: hypothetical protein VK427_00255 [Kofleriaceae bacterium]|nr:hypothetical protein [Kofleriaceae bacterium]
MSARVVGWMFVVALLALFGVVSWLSPLGGDDWDAHVWAAQRRHADSWLLEFFASHYTLADVVGYVIARSTLVHTLLTPVVALAVVVGTFVLATRRRPRFDRWDDVVGLVLVSALVWIAAPRAGLVYFHRPFVATWLYGTALTIWFLMPVRCGLRPRGAWLALVLFAGLVAATSTRQLGLFAMAAVGVGIRRTPRADRGWLWLALAAVTVGTAIGFVDRFFDFRGYKPSFELSLVALNLPIYEGGELVTLVLGLVMVKLVIGALWPHHAGDAASDTRETLAWLGAWVGYFVFALLGPRYSEASLFPAAIILVIGAYPYVMWVMTSRPLRIVVLVLALAVNVVAWSFALRTYVPLHGEYRDRIAKLAAAPEGSTATVTTYRQIRPTFWALGEDWNEAARRQVVATEVYDLQDIELSPAFRRLESNPRLAIRLEVEGVTPEQLRAVGAPAAWATTLPAARVQFGAFIQALRRTVKSPFSARLAIDLPLDVVRGRPLLVAAYTGRRMAMPKVSRKPPDDESRQAIAVRPALFVAAHPEAYVVIGDRSKPVTYARGYRVQVLTTERHAVVVCDPARCFLVDAFIPAF